MTFQESEIANLILGVVSLLILEFVYRDRKRVKTRLKFIYLGFLLIISGYIFTVIEGVLWHDFFNFLEHLSYALSGISFAAGCWVFKQDAE